jgi:hypothetical protein
MGIDNLMAVGIVGRHPRRKLAAVLDIQKHSRQQPGDFFGPLLGTKRAYAPARQMINRRHAAFFVQLAHVCIV